jgi:AcrR family transcriptional regulator
MGRRPQAVRDYGGVTAESRRIDRRGRLLEAGRKIWGESDASSVSVRRVCAESGLGQRYFYEHFADREALLRSIAEQVRDELFSALIATGLADPGDLASKVRSGTQAFLDVIASDPSTHRILMGILGGGDSLAEVRRQGLDLLATVAMELGPTVLDVEPDGEELRHTALFLVGGVTQIIDAWILDPQESTAELAEICTELVLRVLNASGARPL